MTTTLQFLRALYPDPVRPGQLLERTSSKRGGTRRCYWVHTLDEAADHAHRLKKTRDVSFGVALHDPRVARAIARRRWPKVQLPSVRGSHDSAVALPALWAELAAQTMTPDASAPLRELEAVSMPPSIPKKRRAKSFAAASPPSGSAIVADVAIVQPPSYCVPLA